MEPQPHASQFDPLEIAIGKSLTLRTHPLT